MSASSEELAIPAERRPVPWRAREVLFVVMLAAIVWIMTTAVARMFFKSEKDPMFVMVTLILQQGSIFGSVLLWVRFRHRVLVTTLGLRGFTVRNVGIGLLAGLGGLFAATVVGALAQMIVKAFTHKAVEIPNQLPVSSPHGVLLFVTAVSVIVFAPVVEELLFRGMLLPAFRRWMRLWPAILITGAIFAITHYYPIVIPPIFALGVLLAYVTDRTGSIVPAMVAHASFNSVGFLLRYIR